MFFVLVRRAQCRTKRTLRSILRTYIHTYFGCTLESSLHLATTPPVPSEKKSQSAPSSPCPELPLPSPFPCLTFAAHGGLQPCRGSPVALKNHPPNQPAAPVAATATSAALERQDSSWPGSRSVCKDLREARGGGTGCGNRIRGQLRVRMSHGGGLHMNIQRRYHNTPADSSYMSTS